MYLCFYKKREDPPTSLYFVSSLKHSDGHSGMNWKNCHNLAQLGRREKSLEKRQITQDVVGSSVAVNDAGPVASEHTVVSYCEEDRPLSLPTAGLRQAGLGTAVPV